MILGIGVDAVSIERVKTLSSHFLERTYSPEELRQYKNLENAHEDVKASFLASRFAVKEAYAKARGTGFCESVVPKEISTMKDEKGRPFIRLEGKTLEGAGNVMCHLSITHEEPLAIAMVVIESNGENS